VSHAKTGWVLLHILCFSLPLSVTPEIEYITKFTNRLVKETKMQLADVVYLLPEEIPQEIVVQILKGGAN